MKKKKKNMKMYVIDVIIVYFFATPTITTRLCCFSKSGRCMFCVINASFPSASLFVYIVTNDITDKRRSLRVK